MKTPRSEVVVADTVLASALVNARFDAQQADPFRGLIGRRRIVVSFATTSELRLGAIKAGWSELRVRGLERDISRFRVMQPDDDVMLRCAQLRVECKRIGHPLAQKVHDSDRWIATTALIRRLELISNDKVFEKAPGLSLLTTHAS